MVLDASLLSTQHYKVWIKGKVEQSRKGVAPSPTHWCSSYRKGSLRVTLDYGRQLYFTYNYNLYNNNIYNDNLYNYNLYNNNNIYNNNNLYNYNLYACTLYTYCYLFIFLFFFYPKLQFSDLFCFLFFNFSKIGIKQNMDMHH